MADDTSVDVADPEAPRTRDLVAILLVAVLALFGLTVAFSRVSCLLLLPIVVLAAAPIWMFLSQRELLTRQAIIRSVATESGFIQRWFFAGRVTRFLLIFVALGLATALVSLLISLRIGEWIILGADAVLLGLVAKPLRELLGGQIRREHLGVISRLLPILIGNVVVLVVAFTALNLFSGQEVIQGTWIEVTSEAYRRGSEGVTCPGAGALLGAAAAVDQLVWKAAIASIPYLPDSAARFVGWAAFLAWNGFAAVLFTQFMLGVTAIVEDRAGKAVATAPSSTVWRVFVITILALAVPYLYANWKLSQWELSPRQRADLGPPVPVDPCAAFQFDTPALDSSLRADVDEARQRAYEIADQRLEAGLDATFAKAEEGVEKYLDWYFSLYGDYSRLAAVVVGDLGQVMALNLTKHVFDDTGFADLLETESLGIQQATQEQMSGVASQLRSRISRVVDTSACPIPGINLDGLINLDKDRVRAAVSTTSAVTVGTVTAKTLGKEAAAAAAKKAAASGSVKMAAKIAGKAVAKKGGPALAAGLAGTAVCAPAGPAAIVCGITAGVITWVAVDKAAIEIEEYVSRDKMRDELLAALNEQRQAVEQKLKKVNRALVDVYAVEINNQVDKVFVPIRDGL